MRPLQPTQEFVMEIIYVVDEPGCVNKTLASQQCVKVVKCASYYTLEKNLSEPNIRRQIKTKDPA